MSRLDVRVKTRLPASVYFLSGVDQREETVTVNELSLSGALIEGLSFEIKEPITISPKFPNLGKIELFAEVVRANNSRAAVRFYYPDRTIIPMLWDYLLEALSSQEGCPYCGHNNGAGGKSCGKCGNYLDFKDAAYLDRHFVNTFTARIKGRQNRLESEHLQRIISFIDTELLNIQGQSPDREFVGTSPALLDVFSMIRKVARTDMSVLILGESGTGKELTAAAIHERSERKRKPFIAVNCAAIPEGLLEAELFGYEKGAFTGAYATKLGKFEIADGGTLFLDEIGDLSPGLQAKLLRFLEDRTVEKVGAKSGRKVDVRIVAATNCDLNGMIEKGSFRHDLFFRLNAFTIKLPPLRERGEDPVLLAKYFLKKIGLAGKSSLKGFSEAALRAIREYSWPGNVRELINKVRRGAVMAGGEFIEPCDMELDRQTITIGKEPTTFSDKVSEAKKDLVLEALATSNFVIARAARVLRISRPSLYALMKKYEIKLPSQ